MYIQLYDPKGYSTPLEPEVEWRGVGRRERVQALKKQRTHDLVMQKGAEPPDTKAEKHHGYPLPTKDDIEEAAPDEANPFHKGLALDAMTTPVHVVHIDCPLSDAIESLRQLDFDHLPVVTADDTLCGLLSYTDILDQLVHKNIDEAQLAKHTVREVMITPVLSCRDNTSMSKLLVTMLGQGISYVPVVDEQGRVFGVVTYADIARHLAHSVGAIKPKS